MFNRGEQYVRKDQIGCGVAGMQRVFNNFTIIAVGKKTVFIMGYIASGLYTSRKIQIQDFESFLNNYTKK